MSFASVGTLGNATENTSDTSLVITTGAQLDAGNLGVVLIAIDNTATTDADHSEVASVVDSAGNTWQKLLEYTNGQGSAGAGATGALWATVATSNLGAGGTITITLANAVTAKAAIAWEFTLGTASINKAGSNQDAGDGADPAAITIGSLASKEYLWLHVLAIESVSATFTTDADYTTMGQANGGGAGASAMTVAGEFRIFTGTTDTADAGWGAGRDHVQLYVALEEVAAGSSIPVIQHHRQQQGVR